MRKDQLVSEKILKIVIYLKLSLGASVTTYSIVALSIDRDYENVTFDVNRPFIAVIIDRKYGVPYFMGKITDPRHES
jgi:serine protease inhibitor